MTLTAFEYLDLEDQLKAVQLGICVAGRDLPKFKVLLYQLESFYVEVYYQSKYSCVSCLRAFDDTDLLEPYLEKTHLKALLSY